MQKFKMLDHITQQCFCFVVLVWPMRLCSQRNDGEAGADIATLRGSHGPDFEGNATINRGGGIGLPCGCFGGGDDKKEKIILIKGAYCFVFADESDQAPKYAIALAHMKAKIQSTSHEVHPVTIETSLGDIEWELGFPDKDTAQKFVDAFRKQAAIGEADKVREVSNDNQKDLPDPKCHQNPHFPCFLLCSPDLNSVAPWTPKFGQQERLCEIRRIRGTKEIGRPTRKEGEYIVGGCKSS